MPRFVTFLVVALPLRLLCQTPDTAAIHGQVIDASHAAIPGAHVAVRNNLTGLQRTSDTDSSGHFSLGGLPIAGAYDITASKPNFAEAHMANITLAGGTTADVNLQLDVAGGATQVTVAGVVGGVRTDEPQLGDRLDATQMENTPLLNRKITYLPLLNAANRPALNQGDVFINQNLFTTNGAGRRQAWFEVDGSTGSDSWGRQTIFSTIPLAAVQEMTILENAFSAEYGGTTGSAVNIVTKGGGDEFHGELMEMWRPSGTEAALSGFTSTNAVNGNDLTNDTLAV